MQYNINLVSRTQDNYRRILGNYTIAEYYQITPKSGSLEFDITDIIDGRYTFIVKYKNESNLNIDFRKLPVVLNDIINSYLEDFIILEFIVDLRYGFPFNQPIWKLVKLEHSYLERVNICLFDYYEYITEIHNSVYSKKNNWSPSLSFKGDLAIFICRINHFEVFQDY